MEQINFKYFKPAALIPFILAITVLYTLLSHKLILLLKASAAASQINENIHIISTLTLISFSFLFINFTGWKWKIFKWLIDIPNLNGRYHGELISSYKDLNGNPILKDCMIEIKQTASSIKIFSYYADKGMDNETSSAKSISEELVKEENGLFVLYYIYSNDPDTLQTRLFNQHNQLHKHSGAATLKYFPDIKSLQGEYYNQRQNIGTMKARYLQRKTLGRFKV
ncbi:MAG: hypothetical protein ABI594_05010 [Ginsengibacter sp.]